MSAHANPEMHFAQFDLKEREWAVLMAILQLTLFRGRVTALIPQQDYIAEITGLGKSHVSEVLKRLREAKAVVSDGQGRYTIQPASSWDGRLIRTRISEADSRTAEARLAWLHDLDAGEATDKGRITALGELVREPEGLERVLAEQALLDGAVTQEGPATQRGRGAINAPVPVTASEQGEDSRCIKGDASGTLTKQPTGGVQFPKWEPVPKVGTEKAGPPVPKVGTAAAPVQRLNDHRFNAPKRERLNVERLSGAALAAENALLARIAEHVGYEDMRAWGGDWRVHWLRVFPHETIERALADHESRVKTGWEPNNRGAALKDTIRRFAPKRQEA